MLTSDHGYSGQRFVLASILPYVVLSIERSAITATAELLVLCWSCEVN